jgi:ABC-type uncharacterized transport system permease subunit/DNA-binding GntR family transcriptional regulator
VTVLHFAAASNIFSKAVLTSLVAGGLLAGVPLMFTALGETISERAGVLNLGLEGMMLLGAYVGFIAAYYGHSEIFGFLAGMAGGAIGGVVMLTLCVWLGLDQIVVGIAITLAGEGITSVLQGAQFGSSYPRLGAPSTVSIPLLHKIPVLGPSLFNQPLVMYLGFALAGLLVWVYRKTNIGLNLRAAGEKPEALDAAGVSVLATRSWAALATSALAGLGGAYLSIVAAGVFTPFMTQGQGYMAIVICMLARGRPLWVLFGSFLFGISLSIATALQHAPVRRDHPRAGRVRAPLLPAAGAVRPVLQGCQMSTGRSASAPPLENRTLREQVADHLREEILSSRLAPGEELGEVALARSLGISRGPLREALGQLAAEGLVTIVPRRGAVVKQLSRREFIDAYQVREALESLAIKLAVPRLTGVDKAQLHRMSEEMERAAAHGDTDRFFEINREFHAKLVHASGNRKLQEVHGQLVAQMGRLMKKSVELRGGIQQSAAEHRAILEAVDAGNPVLAARLLEEHIEVPQRMLRSWGAQSILEAEPDQDRDEESSADGR